MSGRWWIIDAFGDPVPTASSAELLAWMSGRTTILAEDRIDGDVVVSTYFTGVDMARGGPPRLWETRVLRGPAAYQHIHDDYTSRTGALAGHATILAFVRRDIAARGRRS